jgi:hypothetical protein
VKGGRPGFGDAARGEPVTGVRLAVAAVICAVAACPAVRDHASAGRCRKPEFQALHGTFLRLLTERYATECSGYHR